MLCINWLLDLSYGRAYGGVAAIEALNPALEKRADKALEGIS